MATQVPIGTLLHVFREHKFPFALRREYQGDSWITSVDWSPNGQKIVSASNDFTARVWNAIGRDKRHHLHGTPGEIDGAAWSPDGLSIASIEYVPYKPGEHHGQMGISVWEPTRDTYLARLGGGPGMMSFAWSPDGEKIAVFGAYPSLVLWNWKHPDLERGWNNTSELEHIPADYTVSSLAWSPTGGEIAGVTPQGIQIWQAVRGIGRRLILSSQSKVTTSVRWASNGRWLVSTHTDRTAKIWDLETARLFITYSGHRNSVTSASWSPDGGRIATSSTDKTVQIWEAATARPIFIYRGHTGWFNGVTCVAWSPDGTKIASGDRNGHVHVWQAI